METPHEPERAQPNYLGVFWVLAILTVAEIGVTYLPLPRVPILVPLALVKASLVALFYMHLKFDRRVFSAIFAAGLLMGIGLILSLIALFGPPLLDVK
jgi:cytochrome c oxidase subunit IV